MEETLLLCHKCGDYKPTSAFYVHRARKRGYQSACKECKKAIASAYYRENTQVYKVRAMEWRKGRPWVRHGLTDAAWEALVARSGGFCEVCRTQPYEVIDHDHECCSGPTGCAKCVRGLLCGACNSMLGFARDNPEVLRLGAAYLS